ncbi:MULTISPECIES: NusA-like transcription termination signal-binding factor [Acidianus]|uniref:Probable transcription termination protein NusA n=1 Tax=Candidatus Acidianus copahuensis TaxID=1160895 RepID=A0A031LJX0_9CREN|nr:MULTISPECIES: NusA-like transcription termination signal-binding factor [Acidianus]EZQ03088.1 transcription elongation factor NusA [Candidatus Acidianus copahuensis]NON62940.1 NusA-like transcription termination signal-binding factor [Acidianus sp. RZ1]
MPEIKLTQEEIRYMSLFQEVTRVTAKDCILDEENGRIIFLVPAQEMGLAIGKAGANVKRLRKAIGKDIEIVAYSDNLEDMAKNLMAPARVRSVKVVDSDTKKTIYITVDPQDKGLAIGKSGKNVTRAKLILKRYMDIDSVVVV